MSAITIENDLVHYEVLGRGRPVILIHGWLGSWRYWVPVMQQLSMKYRAYALDLWGFGDSGKDPRRYAVESQVMLLDQFMEKMGITKAALVGHDLGAAVTVRYAALHPDRVPRMMVVNPPLFRMAPRTTPLTSNPPPPERLAARVDGQDTAAPAAPRPSLEAIQAQIQAEAETIPFRSDEMKARIRAALEQRAGEPKVEGEVSVPSPIPKAPREAATPPADPPAAALPSAPLPEPLPDIPAMPKVDYVPDAQEVQVQQANPVKEHLQVLDPVVLLERHVPAGADLEKLKGEVSKADKAALALSVESFVNVDTLRDLMALPMPVVSVHGSSDTFLPAPDAPMLAALKEGRTTFQAITMDETRHFPMLEQIAGFTRLLLDFLEAPDVTKLEIKKTWERRVR